MSLDPLYAMALQESAWEVPQNYEALFDWHYSDERADLLQLYKKGKSQQWDSDDRIDWSTPLDPYNPLGMPEALFPLEGADFFMAMPEREKDVIRLHNQAWTMSQFLHGEQGALLCSAKIVTNVPSSEAKFYAATQVMDEARHVEVYKRFIKKIGTSYPITGPLKTLLDQVLRDSRWDMTYLGMQVVIEGLALAAFANIRDHAQNPLAGAINAYVMQDEARHVAFGRLALKAYYPELTSPERNEREEFLAEACYHMRDRFQASEVWDNLGLPLKACHDYLDNSAFMQMFRSNLFTRIVPVVKDIGLWGKTITSAYEKMGIIGFSAINIDEVQAYDMQVADEFDRRRDYVDQVIAEGKKASA